MARIAYLGPQGTFTEAAMLQLVADIPGFEPVACDSSSAAVEAVRLGAADYACVPIENSIEGSVLPTMDSLSSGSGVQIFAEHTLDVAFSIVVRPGVTADAASGTPGPVGERVQSIRAAIEKGKKNAGPKGLS